jgi:hypothetical protein
MSDKVCLSDIMLLLHSESQMKVMKYCNEKVYGIFDQDSPISEDMDNYKVVSIKHDENYIIVNVIEM